jgi:hypothetical protein
VRWPEESARFPEFARLAPPVTSPMAFLLQRPGPGEDGPVRMHLDLGTDDRAAEVERARARNWWTTRVRGWCCETRRDCRFA